MIETIGQRIRKERKSLNISRGALAAYMGLSVTALGDLENGRSGSTTKLHLAAEMLGVTSRWLETGKPPKFINELPSISHKSQFVSEQRAKIAAIVRLTDYVRDVALEPIPEGKYEAVVDAVIQAVEAIGVQQIMDGSGLAEGARQVASVMRSR